MSEVTQMLAAMSRGDTRAADHVLSLVYEELRRLAASKMARENPGQTLRLGGEAQPNWQNRTHFLAAAAEAMRRILVENARRKLCLKRGGDHERTDLDDSAIQAPAEDEKIVQVNEALDTLAKEDPQKAEIVKLRFFVGLGNEEIAALLGVNEKTVRRHWELAKIQLFQSIKHGQ
jgi:RNA polymerase sigma factor (TIGR02999 family)